MTDRAVIFDLDGTLADTLPDLHRVLALVLQEQGLVPPPAAAVRRMIGDGARVLVERGLAAAGGDARLLDRAHDRFLEIYEAEPCRGSRLFPGVAPLLERLRAEGAALGVCTNKPQLQTELLLRALGIQDRFGAVVGGDALPVRKPDPAHLQAVLARLGMAGRPAVMVGDSANDLRTARAAGLPCILMSFGYTTVPAAELGADLVLDSFADLPPALDRLLATQA